MTITAYNALTLAILIVILVSLAIALFSFVFMIVRWKTPQRRVHVIRLLLSIVAIPCLIGVQQAVLWLVFLPGLGREQMAQMDAWRADRLAATSLVRVGDPVPDFELVDADGRTFSTVDTRGKVVLINFFATWCGPCLSELPHIEELWAKYRDRQGFQLLVIGREETMDSVRAFRSKNGFTFPIAPDADRGVYSLFASELIPRTLVIAPNGIVVHSQAGFDKRDLDELETVIAKEMSHLK